VRRAKAACFCLCKALSSRHHPLISHADQSRMATEDSLGRCRPHAHTTTSNCTSHAASSTCSARALPTCAAHHQLRGSKLRGRGPPEASQRAWSQLLSLLLLAVHVAASGAGTGRPAPPPPGADGRSRTSYTTWRPRGGDQPAQPLGLARRGGIRKHIELNKRISACTAAGELCTLIAAHGTDFNHVNVATAMRKVLQAPQTGVPKATVRKALQTLEEAALKTIEEFGPQEISNTLHIIAKKRHVPANESLIAELGRKAVATATAFNAQAVANTLWAYATMGTRPGERLIRALEAQAEATAASFNAQNVANTLWAYATMGRQPGDRTGSPGRQPGERLMQALEAQAEANAASFNAQNVANTLWAYATMCRKPGERLMQALEERAQAVAASFTTQEVSNTLWAYAVVGRQPGLGLMQVLEGLAAANAVSFNAQAVANTLWAACVFATCAPASRAADADFGRRLVQALAPRLPALGEAECFKDAELFQLHQFFVSCSLLEDSCCASMLQAHPLTDLRALQDTCRSVFVGGETQGSDCQQRVSERLRHIGLCVEDEYQCPKSGYSIDMLVSMPGGGNFTDGCRWAVEFDGPSHFLAVYRRVDKPSIGAPIGRGGGGRGVGGRGVGRGGVGREGGRSIGVPIDAPMAPIDGDSGLCENVRRVPTGATLTKRRHLQVTY
jgi:uncharacterized protein with PIN domain